MNAIELFENLYKGECISNAPIVRGLRVLNEELICGECDGDCAGNF